MPFAIVDWLRLRWDLQDALCCRRAAGSPEAAPWLKAPFHAAFLRTQAVPCCLPSEMSPMDLGTQIGPVNEYFSTRSSFKVKSSIIRGYVVNNGLYHRIWHMKVQIIKSTINRIARALPET